MNCRRYHPARLVEDLFRGFSRFSLEVFDLLLQSCHFWRDGSVNSSFPCGFRVSVPVWQGLLRLRLLRRLRLVFLLFFKCPDVPAILIKFSFGLAPAGLLGTVGLGWYPSCPILLGFRLGLRGRRLRLLGGSVAFGPVVSWLTCFLDVLYCHVTFLPQ